MRIQDETMEIITSSNCPHCPRHCSHYEIQCKRGERYFKGLRASELEKQKNSSRKEEQTHMEYSDDEHGHDECGHGERRRGKGRCPHKHRGLKGHPIYLSETDELSSLLGKCGHMLFHRPGKGRGQKKILSILSQTDEMTQKELQEQLEIQSGSISEILTKLEEKGLLVRTRCEEDRRKVILSLTETGKEKADSFSNEESASDLYAVLSEEEKETLKSLLMKLLNSWETR